MSIAEEVERDIKKKSKLKGFVTPFYEKYSIYNIPTTILSIFQASISGHKTIPKEIIEDHLDGVNKIVLLVVDSMGYKNFLNPPIKDSTLKILSDNSKIIPITSTFPSTTTTALTTINTGVMPQEHGMIGYTMYLKEYGLIANMVDFTPAYDYKWGILLEMGLDPKEFLGVETIYEILNKKGIKPYAITRHKESGLSRMHHTGAKVFNYINSSDLFVILRKLLESEINEEIYTYAYWDLLDAISHIYGPSSEEALAELKSFLYSYKNEFIDKLKPEVAKETLLMITADHGQSEVLEENTIFASDHPELMNKLWIPPTGDSRAAFLYVKQGEMDGVKDYIHRNIKDKLLVLDSNEAIRDGLFGFGPYNKKIIDRVGDLIMLPYSNYSFAYRHRGAEREFIMRGSHGGLSEDEMFVPFICKNLKA
ncbi:MAG: alkaline phosphatase family protein [archaeon]|nr:alkaline phosphatase family protein [archaeon]